MVSNPRDDHSSRLDDPSWLARITKLDEPSAEEAEKGIVRNFQRGGDGWTARGSVARGPKGLVITRLEVIPGLPDDPVDASVTSRMLRDVPVGEILDAVRQAVAIDELVAEGDRRGLGPVPMVFNPPTSTADQIIAASAPAKPSPGRAALPEELMRAIAEGYIAESAPGKPRGAIKRLAAALERPEQTVSGWVVRARKEGWLGPGAAGREGAEPGPRLLEAYAAQRDASK